MKNEESVGDALLTSKASSFLFFLLKNQKSALLVLHILSRFLVRSLKLNATI
jgi:hypothetical protein